jgi:hypothetical protein
MSNPFAGNMEVFAEADRLGLGWGDLLNIDFELAKRAGLSAALEEERARAHSPHLASSGMSDEMTRGPRKQHYTRKAILEGEKEAKRRAHWLKYYPGVPEINWQLKEEARKTRKAAHRESRRRMKKAASGRKSSSGSRRKTQRR